MTTSRRSLPAAVVRQRLLKLDYELSKADIERLEKILPLFSNDENSEASVAKCLERLFGDSTTQNPLADFRAFRSRLKDAAARVGLRLELEVDSKKRSAPSDRRCWFTMPPDPTADHIADWAEQETMNTDDVTSIHSDAVLPGEGIPVGYVVAYDLQDQDLAEGFLSRLKKHVHESEPYDYAYRKPEIWKPKADDSDSEIKRYVGGFLDRLNNKEAAFGLVMLPGRFLDNSDIRREIETGRLPIIVVDLQKNTDGVSEGSDLYKAGDQKEHLASAIARQIKERLDKQKDELHQEVFKRKDQERVAERLVDSAGTTKDELRQEVSKRKEQERVAERLVDAAGTTSDTQYWVSARAQETSLDVATSLPPRERSVSAISALQAWIEDEDAPPYCALLGEYGIGKTTTLKQFAQSLLTQRRQGKEVPLPIFIDLRNYSATIHEGTIPSLEILLQEMLEQAWKTPTRIMFAAQDVLRMVQEEGAVLIFDGLDEKLVHLDEIQGRAFLRTLWHALPPLAHQPRGIQQTTPGRPGRLVFSCRSHYFKTLREQNAMLRGEDRDGVRGTHYRAWFLLPFNEQQIREYLRQVLGEGRVESVLALFKSVHNLPELATRPYLLSLMSGYIGELERRRAQGEVVRAVALYELLVDEWLTRDGGKHQLRPEDKLQLMEDIAADMWREGAAEWPWNRVLDWFSQGLERKSVWRTRYLLRGSQEPLEEDFRTATFVLRPDDSHDRFRFAHTSFQEYFLARYLYRALVDGEQQHWEMDVPSPETLDFLGQLIASDSESRDKALQTMEAILGQGPTQASNIAFRYWLRAVDEKLPEPAPQKVKLRGADLSGMTIRGRSTDRKFNLFAADLSDANLVGSRFVDVDLSHANLSGVQAERAEFHRVAARSINLPDADLTASVWRQCDLSGLTGGETATWYDSRLIACELDPDDLPRDFGYMGTLSDPHDPTRSIPSRQALETGHITTILGHTCGVNACAVTPDGQYIATGSEDNTIKIWDFKSGICVRTLEGHTQRVSTCAITPDGRHLVSGSHDGTLKVWDLNSGACLRTVEERSLVSTCAVTPDSRHLVSGSMDSTLKVWDLNSGACLRILKGHTYPVEACAIAPDGRHLVSGSMDETLKVWDLNSGTCLRTFKGHAKSVKACAITPDGRHLVSGSRDKLLKVWDLNSGACLRTLVGHTDWVEACAITPAGRYLVSGSDDKTLKVWDLESGACLRTLEGHRDDIEACVVTPDGRHLVSGSKNELLSGPHEDILKVWDLESGACLRTLDSHTGLIEACAIVPDGQHLISASFDATLKVWNWKSGECLQILRGHRGDVYACAVTPDGQHLVSGSSDRTLKVWNWKSGECLRTLEGHRGGVYACAVTPDGQHLVSGSSDRTLKVWNWKSGECLRTLEGHADSVGACAVAPDSRHMVSGSHDKTLKVWNLNSGLCVRTLEGHTSAIHACAVTPDGRYAVSGSRGGWESDSHTLRVWNLNSGACLRTLEGHTNWVEACAITPDGRYVVSGSYDNTLKMWDLNSGDCLRTFEGHAASVEVCAITPDGLYLVSGSRDNTLKVWDLKSGVCQLTLINGPDGETAALDYRNNRILSASSEAWRFLGWRYFDRIAGRLRILPVEHAGTLPITRDGETT